MTTPDASPLDECCVLIPSATLEDFPSNTTDDLARGLLAAWTVLWHPELIARAKQTPTWYRADAPPEPDGPRVISVPAASLDQIPKSYRRKCDANMECRWIAGDHREEMLRQLELTAGPELQLGDRTISIEDFYAIGYALLQVQVMTRRLRYTSNLDELYLQSRVVEGAEAFLAGDATKTAEALHDAFDALAEERDHYFSSDPHLIDLNLLTPTVLQRAIEDGWVDALQADGVDDGEDNGVLRQRSNVLIDAEVAEEIGSATDGRYNVLKQLLSDGRIGWAGGGPPQNVCFDALSFNDAEQALTDARDFAARSVGTAPAVYARFTGATPADMTAALVRLNYAGMIPLDFAAGSGHGDESKVIQQGGGAEIESLTAKPIDAASDAAFLNLGARLGESIDSGEVATALLVHWPGKVCDSYRDLCRAASWSVALGKFWDLESYFRSGEQPYHHAAARSSDGHNAEFLKSLLGTASETPAITSYANAFRESVHREVSERVTGLAALVSGKTESAEASEQPKLHGLAAALGANVWAHDSTATNKTAPEACLLLNPHGVGSRVQCVLAGGAPPKAKHIYAVSRHDSRSTDVTVDVTACGFSAIRAGDRPAARPSLARRMFGGGEKEIADQNLLTNEFMLLTIDPKSGGVASVYSGGERGNRFSMRLLHCANKAGTKSESEMVCDRLEVVENSPAQAVLRCVGRLIGSEKSVLADYTIEYRLERGSRLLHAAGKISPKVSSADDPWRNYFACRVAVVNESAIIRSLIRDKIHRSHSRRLVSPLGIVIDEAERQTLVASRGNAFHRRIGDRFVDTLLMAGDSQADAEFEFAFGFDMPDPVSTAKSIIAPVAAVSIDPKESIAEQGWLVHVSPTDCNATSMNVAHRRDGKLAAVVRVVNARPSSARMAVRFCRNVESAGQVPPGTLDEQVNQDVSTADQNNDCECKGDAVMLTAGGHEVVDLLVVFARKE